MIEFINRFIKKPPALFPWVALFHLAMLGFSIYNASSEPLSSIIWLDVLWMVLYTASWLFVCGLKKWAAYMYVGLTLINLVLYMVFHKDSLKQDYISSLFLLDVLFSFFILAYYKKFE